MHVLDDAVPQMVAPRRALELRRQTLVQVPQYLPVFPDEIQALARPAAELILVRAHVDKRLANEHHRIAAGDAFPHVEVRRLPVVGEAAQFQEHVLADRDGRNVAGHAAVIE